MDRKKRLNSISIFIPAYNEEATLREVVTGISDYLKRRDVEYEILLLNDASSDKTLEIMRELSEQNPEVKYFGFSHRQRLGIMMKKGYELALKDWVMMISADGQFRSEYLSHYIDNFDKADIIAGNRVERYRFYPFSRRVVSRIFNCISRYLFRLSIHDVGWSKMVKKDVLGKINLKRTGAIVELELVVKAFLEGFTICEVEVPCVPRYFGKSKCFHLSQIIFSLLSLFGLFFETVLLRHRVFKYLPCVKRVFRENGLKI